MPRGSQPQNANQSNDEKKIRIKILEIKKKIAKQQQGIPSVDPTQQVLRTTINVNLNIVVPPQPVQAMPYRFHFNMFWRYMAPNCFQFMRPKPNDWIDRIPHLINGDEGITQQSCVICLQDFTQTDLVQILACNHILHAHCAKRWLTIKAECPTCRDKAHQYYI